ncbi:hypothetical protein SAMN03080601_01151 [Alkalitalea saponilacus]|uniref:Uncharacterized protein n=1 Tax=Alkalitalea saponilacus TaxID=889453 RepID=A0A1T5DWX6_9BACT|nr:hypothetical protein SAMN03080601_01151 [Alkalitalea saponilacus]
MTKESEIIFNQDDDGNVKIEVHFREDGYFGLTVPGISVKIWQSERSCNIIKKCYSAFKISFLNDGPFKSIRWEGFTSRSSIASAIVPIAGIHKQP